MSAPSPPPPRPLLAAALALGAGALTAQGLLDPQTLGITVLSVTALVGWAGTRSGDRLRRWAPFAALAVCAGLRVAVESAAAPAPARTSASSPLPSPAWGPPSPAESARSIDTWRWVPNSGARGSGGSGSGRLIASSTPSAAVAARFDTYAPRAGEWLQCLAAGERVQTALGPVLAPGGPREWLRWSPDEIVRLGPAQVPGALERLRTHLLERVRTRLPEQHVGLFSAVLLGERRELGHETGDLFTRTGLRHLLAVSGLHVALLLIALVGPLARLNARALAATGLLSRRSAERGSRTFLLLVFVPLAGAAAPVVRAALAAVLAVAAGSLRSELPPAGTPAPSTGRRVDPLSLWGAALALECLWEPGAIGELSVQLSYAAVLALITCTRPLTRLLRPAPTAPARLEPRGWSNAIQGRVNRWALSALAASLAATLGTLPIAWARFGEFSPWGVLLTPLAIPLLTVILVSGWLALLTPLPGPGRLAGLSVDLGLDWLELADRLPGTPFVLPERPALWVTLLCLLTCACIARQGAASPRSRRALRWGWALTLVPWTTTARYFELHALDVGHGTCVVLRAPGEPAWIFDAGSRSRPFTGSAALGPLLRSWEVRRPSLVLSHDDRDHASAFGWLLERYPPKRALGAFGEKAQRLPRDCERWDPMPGGSMQLAGASGGTDPLRLELVRGVGGTGNEGSHSLLVRWREQSLLLSGDAEREGLDAILAALAPVASRQTDSRPFRMLLAPHHGTSVGRVPDLLDSLRPAEVWISCAARPALAAELERRGIPWRSTSAAGPLRLELP